MGLFCQFCLFVFYICKDLIKITGVNTDQFVVDAANTVEVTSVSDKTQAGETESGVTDSVSE